MQSLCDRSHLGPLLVFFGVFLLRRHVDASHPMPFRLSKLGDAVLARYNEISTILAEPPAAYQPIFMTPDTLTGRPDSYGLRVRILLADTSAVSASRQSAGPCQGDCFHRSGAPCHSPACAAIT